MKQRVINFLKYYKTELCIINKEALRRTMSNDIDI